MYVRMKGLGANQIAGLVHVINSSSLHGLRKSEVRGKTMTEHTKEPWTYQKHGNEWLILNSIQPVAKTLTEEKAIHIIACVNACAGIPIAALESGVIGELVEAVQSMADTCIPSCTVIVAEDGDTEWRRILNALAKLKGEKG